MPPVLRRTGLPRAPSALFLQEMAEYMNKSHETMLAYLVIREGTKWTDVFRLVPGRTVTIGCAATNQIVVKDERASRSHGEVFLTEGRWTLRDLESRNGTMVGNRRVHGDYPLTPGDIIRIAQCQLAFVHDLSQAFPDTKGGPRIEEAEPASDDSPTRRGVALTSDEMADLDIGGAADAGEMDEADEPATITHRRGQTRFLKLRPEGSATPRVGHAAAMLCRLAFELAKQTDIASVANRALEGLFEGTKIDAGAVLLGSRNKTGPVSATDLEVVATRTDVEPRYHRISGFLANTVLREGEAVLARNVMDDSVLGTRDSKGEIHSTSVICAPIREGANRTIGLIHLYSTVDDRQPDPDDLEFTLAVADNVALAIEEPGTSTGVGRELVAHAQRDPAIAPASGSRKRDCGEQFR